jgi:hypothetical protein
MSEFFAIPKAEKLLPSTKPLYGKPVELGCYSFDEQRAQSFDRSQMVKF